MGDAILRYVDLDAQAKTKYEVFVRSSAFQLVDTVLQNLRTNLLNVALTSLEEGLNADAQLATVKEALKVHQEPRLAVPESLQRRVEEEMRRMLKR